MSYNYRQTCPICKKVFWPQVLDEYAYQKTIQRKGIDARHIYFCSWHCLREWEKIHEPPEPKRRRVYDWEVYHTCFDCRFYKDKTRECLKGVTLHPYPDKDACSTFREVEENGSSRKK